MIDMKKLKLILAAIVHLIVLTGYAICAYSETCYKAVYSSEIVTNPYSYAFNLNLFLYDKETHYITSRRQIRVEVGAQYDAYTSPHYVFWNYEGTGWTIYTIGPYTGYGHDPDDIYSMKATTGKYKDMNEIIRSGDLGDCEQQIKEKAFGSQCPI